MKNYRLLTFIFALLIAGSAIFSFLRQIKTADLSDEIKVCKIVLPNADGFLKKNKPLPHYAAYRSDPATGKKQLIGITFLTTDIAPEIRSYGGHVKMMVGIDTHAAITGVSIVSQRETPAYASRLDIFVDQFKNKTVNSPLKLGEDIDGITGATISSRAITRAIKESVGQAAAQILNISTDKSPTPPAPFLWDQVLVPIFLFILAMIGILRCSRVFRRLALLGGLFYLGILTHTMISAAQISGVVLVKFPSFYDSPLWYMLMGLNIISAFVFGMVYCGSVCPFAGVEESLHNLAGKIKPDTKIKCSPSMDAKARYIKYGVLAAALITGLITENSGAAAIEPFITFFTGHATSLGWALLALMLFAALFNFRFWCKYLCPIGAFNGLLSRYSLCKIRVDKGCTRCRACEEICPTQAITVKENQLPEIDNPECILCTRCIQKCPEKVLSFKKQPYEKTR